jgi:hypothetical protein
MLGSRIASIKHDKSIAEAKKEREKEKQSRGYSRTTTTRRRTTVNPVVKVLTSATFIRGVMGVLTKAMK